MHNPMGFESQDFTKMVHFICKGLQIRLYLTTCLHAFHDGYTVFECMSEIPVSVSCLHSW